MAWSSFIPSATIRDALKGVILPKIGAASTPDTLNVALYNATAPGATNTIDTDPLSYSATNEVTGTNWAAGGVALTGVTNTLVTGVGIMIDANDVSVASTTISTGVFGCLVYDNTLTPKAGLVAVWFGGTSYTTNNGTFGIVWDVNGLFRITLH